MLDIKFYQAASDINSSAEIIDITESLYEFLIESGFSQIGKSQKSTVLEDGEEIDIYAVHLSCKTRNKFHGFFQRLVLEEAKKICNSKKDASLAIEEILGKLKTLNSLYEAIENKGYYYLDRGDEKEKSKQKYNRSQVS